MRILIAEDEVATAKALKLLLEKSKFSVDIVHTGTDAWDYVKEGAYEVVVLDIMMPGLSGLEVLERMRKEGFKIWLDDFGSGYSSLNVLKDYDFDVLKIDMRFLEDFGNSDNLRSKTEWQVLMPAQTITFPNHSQQASLSPE